MSDTILGRIGQARDRGVSYNALNPGYGSSKKGGVEPSKKSKARIELIEINGEQVEAVIKVFGNGEEMLFMVNGQQPDYELSKAFDAGDYKVVGR